MESLIGYGSDEDTDESPPGIKQKNNERRQEDKRQSEADANYEEVQMDLSEDSNEGGTTTERANRTDRKRASPRRDSKERKKREEQRPREDRHRRDRGRDERSRGRERDKDKGRGREHEGRERKEERRSRRSASRERQKSRSPRRSRRSSSRDRMKGGRRYDRASYRMDRLEKLGIEMKSKEITTDRNDDTNKGRFFMPGISGRFTQQIQRRKMLWQKKPDEPINEQVNIAAATSSAPVKLWQNTTFAQDSDGKVASKFKRLMGMKGAEQTAATEGGAPDILKKQEEMFTTMEAQYEVARTATHTMRGVGLGFGSFQR